MILKQNQSLIEKHAISRIL